MVKREKVIKGLECCLGIRNICLDNPECPYNDCEDRACGDGCMSFMMRDALALLKAREAVEPVPAMDDGWECGACGGGVVGVESEKNMLKVS